MEEIIVKIDGMMCAHCEAHMNDVVRQNFNVKKVSSSHSKGETVIITEGEFDEAKLREVTDKIGYRVLGIERKPYEKKRIMESLFHK